MIRFPNAAALILLASPLTCWAMTVQDAVRSRPDLSTFNAIATRFPTVLGDLTSSGGTLLAPTNDALAAFLSTAGIRDLASVTEATARELVSYHILPLSLRSTDLSREGGALADTRLLSDALANLDGQPNVVFASAFGSTGQEQAPSGLKIYSGVGTPANVTGADVEFDGGYLHVIDQVLNLPKPCTDTAETAGLSTLLDALQTTNLTEVVDTTPKFTCFAPTDAAFEAAGIDIHALSTDQLADALKYHSIVGDVGYSTAFEDGREYQTLLGVPVTVHKRDGQMFINDVAVAQGNVIMTNGVAHVLSGVLSPPPASSSSTTSGTGTSAGGTSSTTTAPGSSGTAGGSTAGNSALPTSANGVLGIACAFALAFGFFL